MAEKDTAFRRMLGNKELFLRFARRYLGRETGHFERGITVALAMLENGEPEEKILLYTGSTQEQLDEIREGRLLGTNGGGGDAVSPRKSATS